MDELPGPEDFKFSCPIEVRFRDLDAMGHVNNAVYFTYFEVARTGYMRALGHCDPATPSLPELYPFILLDVHCRYLAPVVLADELTVHLRTTGIRRKSYEFEYLVTKASGGEVVAVGRSTQVYYDYREGKTLPVPEEFRSLVEKLEGRNLSVQ